MLKTLLATLLLFSPCVAGSFNSNFNKESPNLLEKIEIKSVESDGFLTYWREDFRKDEQGEIIPICNIKYQEYSVMYSRYVTLSSEDKIVVDATPDYEEGYTIKDSIKELVRLHGSKRNSTNEERRTLDQSSTITIIVVIAVFGMSVICIFFVMKNTNLIQ